MTDPIFKTVLNMVHTARPAIAWSVCSAETHLNFKTVLNLTPPTIPASTFIRVCCLGPLAHN